MYKRTKITIFGAGNVGCSLARKILELGAADVVIWNRSTKSYGIALDLRQSGAHSITGTNDYQDTAHSDIIVIAAGAPRHPGMSRDELFKINASIVTEVTQKAIAHSPGAILIVVTNPLDVMTYIAWHVSRISSRRVIGISGTLDSARFKSFVAESLQLSQNLVQAIVIGCHNDCMIPLPRYCSVGGIPLSELMDIENIRAIVERTRHSGSEIVELMQKSAYYAPANAIYEVIEAILFNQAKILPVSAYLTNGEYGLYDIFLGTPCRIGKDGIEHIQQLQLTSAELALLHRSAQLVRQNFSSYIERIGEMSYGH
jgi:malate dehydrogenase